MTEGNEFAVIGGSPAPGGGTFTGFGAEGGVGFEVVKIDLVLCELGGRKERKRREGREEAGMAGGNEHYYSEKCTMHFPG